MADTAEMTPQRRRYLTRFLRMFMREVRWLFRRRTHPDEQRPCRNCAFNPGTDSARGFESTAWALLQALKDDRPFYCHAGTPWRKPREEWTTEELRKMFEESRYCAGWATVATFGPDRTDSLERIARRASRRAGEVPE